VADEDVSTASAAAIEACIPALRRYARALTRNPDRAEDLVQDCVERALHRRDQFQPGTNLRTWLFTILHNLNCDAIRREQRRGPHVPIEEWSATAQMPADQPGYVHLRDIDRALDGLAEKDRRILLMVGCDEYSYEEASAELDIAVGTVKSRLSRARARLKALDDRPA
jgi:RNA polymerase sigma-70 factor (ECF subfamily)